ncbi:MAG: TspO/MBR family protein [Chloroflexota bacterium]
MRARSLLGLGGFLAASFGAAAFGSYFTSQTVDTWYPTLEKPSWRPPNSAFGPVWTTLYTLMAVSAWLVWKRDAPVEASPTQKRSALAAWVVQLLLNAAWSATFFGAKSPGGGLAVISLLVPSIATTAALSAKVSKPAGLLLLPYLAWTSFAAALNTRIWQLND